MSRARRPGAPIDRPSGGWELLVTDIDGTLTDAARRLDLRAVDALRRFRARDRPVILATGNVLPIALALHRSLGLAGPIVAENGGLIYDRRDGRDRVRRLADRSIALRALRRLRSAGLPVRPLFTDRWRESEVALEPTVPIARIRRALAGEPILVESTGYAIHLMEAGAGKLEALAEVLPELGVGLERAIVTGDGDNDVAMLRAAGVGVSFPNGSAKARRAARLVTRAAYGAGFVEALKRLRA